MWSPVTKQVVKVIWHKVTLPSLHSAHPSPETKQHLDLFSHFCTAHCMCLQACTDTSFPLKIAPSHGRYMVPFAHASPQHYGVTVQTWRIIISYWHVCTVIPWRFSWYHNVTLYMVPLRLTILSYDVYSYLIWFSWLNGYQVLTGVEIRYSTR